MSSENIQFSIIDANMDEIIEPIVEENISSVNQEPVPKLVFLIPYRNRTQQCAFYKRHMAYILEDLDKNDYKIYFVHQCDKREFNRGALKNIGFLTVRTKYPKDYHNITLIFNDVDTMPFTKNFLNYQTKTGTVKHFYGFTFALGGIVSITAGDFERIGGFPNFWAWGYEDNMLNSRVLKANLNIDRTHFYGVADENILNLNNGMLRTVNRKEFDRYAQNTKEGWHSIRQLFYTIDEPSNSDIAGFINVTKFSTGSEENKLANVVHDLRNGNKPFPATRKGHSVPAIGMFLH